VHLGDEQLLHLRLRDTPLLAKIDIEERVAPGEQSTFRIPTDKLHLFDAETELALRV
jgi:ABC-type sugar transport system ATPase subunit